MMGTAKLLRSLPAVMVWLLVLGAGPPVRGANQTADVAPIQPGSSLPYSISLRPVDFGPAEVPTLQSFAVGHDQGRWILLAGRTNGMHGFSGNPLENFPPEYTNREVWVIDPLTRKSWRRSLDDPTAGLSENEILSLTPTNNQFLQQDTTLYMTGGYGIQTTGGFGTFDALSALDLPGLADWVITGQGTAAEHIRQTHDPLLQVTGGAMYELGGRIQLVFGQDFQGGYNPFKNGTYTNQVRSFEIVDDGSNLAIANLAATTPQDEYRRRDLNVFPVMRPDGGGGIEEGIVVLSGVFTPTGGAWTVPVEIDESGQPTMADPHAPDTFKQGFNNYHSAKLGMFSATTGQMHEILFGGISLQYLDPDTGIVETDQDLPFTNDITAVVIDAEGNYTQHHLGYFPDLTDVEGNPWRFGANAEFFLAEGIANYDNGVIRMNELTGETMLGYIYGGIASNMPHTRGVPDAVSIASGQIFEVVFRPVPEPHGGGLALLAAVTVWAQQRGRRRAVGR